MQALLDGYWFDAVAGLLDSALNRPEARGDVEAMGSLVAARDLAVAARRVLDLDAEDFGLIAAGFDTPWASRLAARPLPAQPPAGHPGAPRAPPPPSQPTV